MQAPLCCYTCGDPLSDKVYDSVKLQRQKEFRFTPMLELLARMYPDPFNPAATRLQRCCIAQIITYINSVAKINSFNPVKTIVPTIRRNIAPSSASKKRKMKS